MSNTNNKYIYIKGAKTHNLKNINVKIPRNKIIVITGLSGSGKSSLAFDTLYAEGQRRYVASLSAYARQFLDQMDKPEVEYIEGLSPAISIEQKATSHNPRSTVGTVTEIYDYLRLLFARIGEAKCPEHQQNLKAQTTSQIVDQILSLKENTKAMILAPVIRDRKGEYQKLLNNFYSQGFIRAKIDGDIYSLEEPPELDLHKKHNIEIIIDRFKIKKNDTDLTQRLAESVETALKLADGLIIIDNYNQDKNHDKTNNKTQDSFDALIFSSKHACPICQYSIDKLEPKNFSFNNPSGACKKCDGLGSTQEFDKNLIIPDDSKSLNQGAILHWQKSNDYYYNLLDSIAKYYKFSLDTPFRKLDKNIQDIILYGSNFGDNNDIIPLKIVSLFSASKIQNKYFEGVIPNLNKRYKQTKSKSKLKSKSMLNEFAKFINTKTCDNCNGSRLNIQANNVFINTINLSNITSLPVDQAFDYFQNIKLDPKSEKNS